MKFSTFDDFSTTKSTSVGVSDETTVTVCDIFYDFRLLFSESIFTVRCVIVKQCENPLVLSTDISSN